MIQLTITLDPQTAQIGVSGPINDKTLCYGMLESAKDAIREHCRKQSGIIKADPALVAAMNYTDNPLA
jgi:hypothetical protein